ncbi:hypothetical protein L873DRAFT_322457 [Choiromyces venosus 120613-1]|uniref:Uncharacterized protein n=1 Tax=Choiromyces venosus 120613-1 TaxID=1336337 RepID=A0A3N4JWY5_9PEZI|nr:hypothetical protein L873DRAFT_322457 [Choiromyces venosus 120613-1]
MEPIQETPPIAASVTSLEEKISSPRQLSKEPETPVISSGEAVAIPPSTQVTQSAIYTSITLEHKKITNALLTAMGKGELIETPVPEDLEDAKDIEELEDFLKVESLKRMERNDIVSLSKEKIRSLRNVVYYSTQEGH